MIRDHRRAAPWLVVGRRWDPSPADGAPARPCARPGCTGRMHEQHHRLPARYVSRAGHDGPPAGVPLLRVWTCDRCGAQEHEETGTG